MYQPLGPVSVDTDSFTYYPDGKLCSRMNDARHLCDSFFYTPGVAGFTSKRTHNYYPHLGAGPLVLARIDCHVNALGQKDTTVESYSQNDSRVVTYLTYNNEGNPITRTE